VTVDRPLAFRVQGSDGTPVRALLDADRVYDRARRNRQIGVTMLAVAGGASWVAWSMGGAALPHMLLAAWLAALVFTVRAVLLEAAAWRRLHRAVEETKR
jgi:hypothetical protein